MDIKITQKNSVLKTAGKFIEKDINLSIDESLLGGGTVEEWDGSYTLSPDGYTLTLDVSYYPENYKEMYISFIRKGVLYENIIPPINIINNVTYFKYESGDGEYLSVGEFQMGGESYTEEQVSAGIYLTADAKLVCYWSCFLEGTPITLSDGSTKSVEEITYDDELLVWDFDNAEFASAKPLWIMKEQKATQYNHLVFSDGSELNTINQHRIFNVEKGMFTYPMTDDTPIGTTTFNDKGEFVTLVSKEVVEKEVKYYNIITDYHINLFAGSILTSCRLSNIYPIVDMKYVKDDREIIPLSEFNVPEEYYYGLRLGEQPIDINRDGAVSFGDESVEDYVNRLISLKKE